MQDLVLSNNNRLKYRPHSRALMIGTPKKEPQFMQSPTMRSEPGHRSNQLNLTHITANRMIRSSGTRMHLLRIGSEHARCCRADTSRHPRVGTSRETRPTDHLIPGAPRKTRSASSSSGARRPAVGASVCPVSTSWGPVWCPLKGFSRKARESHWILAWGRLGRSVLS